MKITFKWERSVQRQAIIGCGDRRLYIAVSGKDSTWVALAIETAADADGPAALEEHAHKLVGIFKKATSAQRGAEKYARLWQRTRARELLTRPSSSDDRCGCDDIQLN